MLSSSELEKLILKLYKKEASGGLFNYAQQLYSHQEGALLIGSEPGDKYEGYEAIIEFYRRVGASGVEIEVDEIQAYAEGLFGWVVDRVTARLADGLAVPVRHTYVFHQEENVWKVVHAHISVGIPDKVLGNKFKA